MAQVIEFYTLARFTPTVNWTPDEQRGKVIPFMSQREVSDELVCRNISPRSARSTVPCLVLDERHERYPGASHRMGHRRIQWRKRGPCFSHCVRETYQRVTNH